MDGYNIIFSWEELNELAKGLHKGLTGGLEELEILYEPSVTAAEFEQKLAQNRDRDLRMKLTSVGPHRDDFCVKVNGIDIRKFGSQGQQRTAALSLKLSEIYLVKEKIKDAVLMFVTAPDAGTLRDRLVGRGTETPEVIAARLARACEESEGIENYDYLVVNDTVDHASALIDQLICDEQSQNTGRDQEYRVSANIDFINHMRENLKSFSKGE